MSLLCTCYAQLSYHRNHFENTPVDYENCDVWGKALSYCGVKE